MNYLITFSLPLFSFLWAEAIAAEYTVTPHDLRIDCYDNPSTGVMLSDQNSSDALDLTAITGKVKCMAGDFVGSLPYSTQTTDDFPVTLSYPAVNLNVPVRFTNLAFSSGAAGLPSSMYADLEATVSGDLNFPPFSVVLDGTPPNNPGECTNMSADLTPELNLHMEIANGGVANIFNAASAIEVASYPSSLVAIPPGATYPMTTEGTISQPMDTIDYIRFKVCKAFQGYAGFIDIELAFRPQSAYNSSTGWNYRGRFNISVVETGDEPSGYTATLQAEELSNAVSGELVNVTSVPPGPLSPTISYEASPDPNSPIKGWMEIDFSLLTNQVWAPFTMEFVLPEAGPTSQQFPNIYAIGLSHLLRNSPGSNPQILRLPVTEQNEPETVFGMPVGNHQLTIKYKLYEVSGN